MTGRQAEAATGKAFSTSSRRRAAWRCGNHNQGLGMVPECFRNRRGFAASSVASLSLFMASPALAQGLTPATLMGAAPVTIAIGAAGFALIAAEITRRVLRDLGRARQRAAEQAAGLRARIDEYEGLLSAGRELVVLWTDRDETPRFLGPAATVLPPGKWAETALSYAEWLEDAEARLLAHAVHDLRQDGRAFEVSFKARDGRMIRAFGAVLGTGAVLRLRPASIQPDLPESAAPKRPLDDAAKALISGLAEPAFLRDADGELQHVNAAYIRLAAELGRRRGDGGWPELVEQSVSQRHWMAVAQSGTAQQSTVSLAPGRDFDLVEFPMPQGTGGYFRARPVAEQPGWGLNYLRAIIDALESPIVIFGPSRELIQANRAYCELWGIDPTWLKQGMDERAILDRLRTEGKLPAEPDYQGWRARHLTAYELKAPERRAPWHLPDGRTLNVIAAPAGARGGVIYVFEDITDQLKLQSAHKAMVDVQRSTLNALSEAVAVFGTNGRLTLANPRLATLWGLPAELMSSKPHIDQIAVAAGHAMPEDGKSLWIDLKRAIIDLTPARGDQQGRLARADGKLIDYAITRLPDGQSMMTFLDVTESANYQRVLKERNDALVTADRLKDAFVQNVSYELRSPLTNIIGFADLLASGSAGPLNERQHNYTDYIRASSVSLGVLIDNILDLATVDAGIAELRPTPQSIPDLVERARAGVVAAFPRTSANAALNIRVRMAEHLPPFIADGTRMVQVLYNLLANAARYAEPGSDIVLSVEGRGSRVQFVVEDEGTRSGDQLRAALADSYDPAAIAARQRGEGLGLAIVRAFVSLHGGAISIENRAPHGTRVVVSLPANAASVASAGAA